MNKQEKTNLAKLKLMTKLSELNINECLLLVREEQLFITTLDYECVLFLSFVSVADMTLKIDTSNFDFVINNIKAKLPIDLSLNDNCDSISLYGYKLKCEEIPESHALDEMFKDYLISYQLDTDNILKQVKDILFSCSDDNELNFNIYGVHLDFIENDKVKIVTTNTHRMTVRTHDITSRKNFKGIKLTIDRDKLDLLKTYKRDSTFHYNDETGSAFLSLYNDKSFIKLDLMDWEYLPYPPYQKVLISEPENIVVSASELNKMLECLPKFSKKKEMQTPVLLKTYGGLGLYYVIVGDEENKIKTDVCVFDSLEILLNLFYLKELLTFFKGNDVFWAIDKNGILQITSQQDVHVLMTMRKGDK